jgi:hypothetical protein
MGRKTLKKPEPTQAELEAEHLSRTQVVAHEKSNSRIRHRGLQGVPTGEPRSKEVYIPIADVIEENAAECLGWGYEHRATRLTAEQWAENVVRAVRYGIPQSSWRGEGFSISEEEISETALYCPSCEEEL